MASEIPTIQPFVQQFIQTNNEETTELRIFHNRPVMRNTFLCHDTIMWFTITVTS